MDVAQLNTLFSDETFKILIKVIIMVVFTILLERISRRIVFGRKDSKVKVNFVKNIFSLIVYFIGFGIALYFIPSLQKITVSLFAGAGVLAIVIGFAAQKAFANIISGLFIMLYKPFKLGDVIRVQKELGVVEDITVRHTVIKNFENKRLVIPNAIISEETIENYNLGDHDICKFVEFGISYESDVDLAMKIMQKESEKHPLSFDNRSKEDIKNKKPKVQVRVVGYGDSSVNLKAWVWTKSPADAFILGCDLNKSIKKQFDKKGIEIPYPHRTIIQKKDGNKK